MKPMNPQKEVFAELKESAPEISRFDFFVGCALIAIGAGHYEHPENIAKNAIEIAKAVISESEKKEK